MLLENMKEILQEIYRVYLKQLLHLEIPHQKLVICFSGIPGSGKTALAKKIEERYLGVRINNDDLRRVIAEVMEKYRLLRNEENNQKMLHDSLAYFFSAYLGKNKLIILDSSIDRTWKEEKKWFEESGYSFFIIRMDISLEEIHRRLQEREMKMPERNFERLKHWKKEYAKAKREIKADFTVKDNSLEEVQKLFEKLDEIIR